MEKYDGISFDEAMKLLEEKISLLEKDDESEKSIKTYEEAIALKNYCAKLLADEREEIERVAKENNIPLSEIGLTEDDTKNEEDKNN